MLGKIVGFADRFDMFPGDGAVLVALSGGVDSVCLLDVLLEISLLRGFSVCAAHFNHQLRGGEGDRDEAFAAGLCKERGVELLVGTKDVGAFARSAGLGIEEAARELRYGFLLEAAEEFGAVRIATAHTADDLAETIIMNLTRGAGTSGFCGIPPVRGAIIRPMLHIPKNEIMNYAEEREIEFVFDSTNCVEDRTRNKIRHSVIPVLREINPRFIESTIKAADLARYDEEYLSGVADEISVQCTVYSAQLVSSLPFALASRVVRKLCGKAVSFGHVCAVLKLCEGVGASGSVSLPGMVVRREYDRIVFDKHCSDADGFVPVFVQDGQSIAIPSAGLSVSCKSTIFGSEKKETFNETFTSFLFHVDGICGRISVRPRRAGDKIRLKGRNCTKSLKKLFIEHRVPSALRAFVPVIADDMGVLAVCGICMGDRAVPSPGDRVFEVEFRIS